MSDTQLVERPATKRDFAEGGIGALNKDKAAGISVSRVAGGVSFATALEVMEFAKMMALAQQAVPGHCRNNPGVCLAITFQAVEWGMSPFAVANKSYVVKPDQPIAFESQLVHAVIEARAPLMRRLECEYEGEGPERVCIVTGYFDDGSEREYRSPKFKDIQPKNSPLWRNDPDQQQWYYSSRSWARKWCPDVLMGIYTRDELEDDPAAGREGELVTTGGGLGERLKSAAASDEGFHGHEHAHRELAALGKPGQQIEEVAVEDATAEADKPKKTRKRKTPVAEEVSAADGTTAVTAPVPQEPKQPTTDAEYIAYARAWIGRAQTRDDASARWDGEKELRDELQVPISERTHLINLIAERFPLTV